MIVAFVMGVSIVLQFTAAILALRLIRVTGGRVAWILIATAVFLMGVRRAITLSRLLTGDTTLLPDLQAELVALVISILMVVGIALIGPFLAAAKRSTKAVEESERKYRELAESITAPIFALDEQLRYTYWNQASERLTGISAKNALGNHLYDVFPHTKATKVAELEYVKALKTKKPRYFISEYRFRDKDYVFDISAYPTREGLSVFARDITEREQAQQKVEHAAREWRTTFDTIPDLVSIHDKDFKVVRLNRAFAQACRTTPQAVVGSTCYELIHGTKEPCPECPLQQALTTHKSSWSEYFNPHLGIRTEVTCSPIINGSGNASAAVHIIRDVTERRQMLETLQESEERYRLLADNAADVIWTVDLSMRPTYISPSITRLLGYTPEEAMTKPMEEVFTPASNKLAMGVLAEELAKEELKQRDLFRSRLLEMHMIHKDGSTVPVEVKYTFLHDADSKPVGVLAIARDITERKQMEAALRDSESKYRTIFETTGVATVIIDEDTTISLANTEFEKLSGYSKKEIEGKKSWTEFVLKDDLERMKAYHRWRRVDPATAPNQYEFQFVSRNDNVKHILLTADLILGTKRSIASLLDITERKQLQEQLIVADRLATLGELISGVAHELNNPLTSIIGFAQLLSAKDIPNDVKEDLGVIYNEAERTSKIVKNLLTFARKHEPEKKPVNINEAIKAVLALRSYEHKVHNIQVNTQFASDLPEITADGFQLQQVFLNIIINAEYFMVKAHGKGNLNIVTGRAGDTIRASFTDDGPGIPQENLGRLFDPFFTTKEVGKGTGLGLSICHGIIAEQDGSIYAQSEPGEGATFTVELPISKNDSGEVSK